MATVTFCAAPFGSTWIALLTSEIAASEFQLPFTLTTSLLSPPFHTSCNFSSPRPSLLRAEPKLLPHISPSPGSWVSASTQHHVKAILPFRTNPISTMPDWASFYNKLHNSTLSDDSLISPPFPNWLKHSAAYTLKDMHTFLCDNHLFHKAQITVRTIRSSIHNLDNPKGTQKHISNWIQSLSAPFSVEHFLAHRWKRWFQRPILDSNIRVAQKIASLTSGFPQNVLNSILRSWLNSWFTPRRFQKNSLPVLPYMAFNRFHRTHGNLPYH